MCLYVDAVAEIVQFVEDGKKIALSVEEVDTLDSKVKIAVVAETCE